MHTRSRALRSALLLSAMGLAVGARGVPVLLGDADTASSAVAAESGRAAPAARAPLLEGAAPPGGEVRAGAPPAGRGKPGPVAAADTSAAQATGVPPDPSLLRARANVKPIRLPSASNPAASAAAAGEHDGHDIDPDLKQAVKTALDWARDAKQLVQPANKVEGDAVYKDAAASGERGPGAGPAAGESGNAAVTSGSGSVYLPGSEAARLHDREPAGDVNLVREGIKLIRDLAESPLTWLLLPILAFGMLAWRALLHGGQARTRRVRGRDGRGARALAQTGRRPGEGRSNGKAGGPSSTRRSDRG